MTSETPHPKSSDDTYRGPQRSLLLAGVNRVGAAIERLGIDLVTIDPDQVIAEAERKTGLSDFGDPGCLDRMRRLVADINAAGLNLGGRLNAKRYVIDHAVNRLQLEQLFKVHPEILDIEIERPLFIVGWHRTGTTLLHHLLAEDPDNRAPRFWEMLYPAGEPWGDRPRDGRRRQAQRVVNFIRMAAPQIQAIHPVHADWPEECFSLWENDFVFLWLAEAVRARTYLDSLSREEIVGTYRYYKKQLQALLWQHKGERLVLKCPLHQWYIDIILELFPDACFVQTHRKLAESLPSACSLLATDMSASMDVVDRVDVGDYWTKKLAARCQDGLAARKRADAKQFFDVAYSQLVRDPIAMVQAIYAHFGLTVSDAFLARMRAYMERDRGRNKPGHQYSLEQFGLTLREMQRRFAPYLTHFASLGELEVPSPRG